MATIETQDLVPVHSRVSWSAIFAGTVVALAVYLLLSALGAALGLSIVTQVGDRELGIGAVVWAIAAMLISLFLGGWVTSQCTVGENKTEAVVYGVIMWGTVFALLLWLMASGVRMGFNAVMSLASTQPGFATSSPFGAPSLTEEDLRAAGFTPEEITSFRANFDRLRAQNVGQQIRTAAEDPLAAQAAWWTFGGIFLSILAAVAGALVGSGPNVMLTAFGVRSIVVDQGRAREPVNR